jgi:hypothetical protein
MEDIEEKWIDIEECGNKYKVSNLGYVYNKVRQEYLKPYDNGKILIISLKEDGKVKTLQLHRLTGTLFVDNPNNYKYLVHINGDYKDNKCTNLVWCKQNHLPIYEATDENWKIIKSNPNFEISKDSVIRNLYNKTITSQYIRGNYYTVTLSDPKRTVDVHILMAELFLIKPDDGKFYTVDHIDNKETFNNHISNLRYATPKEQCENKRNSNIERLTKVESCNNKTIRRINIDTDEILQSYDGVDEVIKYLRDHGITDASNKTIVCRLLECLNHSEDSSNQTRYGYKWQYEEIENLEGEIWKSTKEAFPEGREYMVSNMARVLNYNKMLIIGCPDKRGTPKMYISGVKGRKYLHRLVALVHLPNPLNLSEVNHIDGDPTNNKLSNLEWCSKATNIRHAIDTGLCSKIKKVKTINMSTDEVVIYNTKKEAYTAMKIDSRKFELYLDTNENYGDFIFETVQ